MTTNTTVVSFIPRARQALEEVSCCSDVMEGEEEAAASRSQVTDRSPVNPSTSRTVLRDIIGDFDPLPFCLRTCDSSTMTLTQDLVGCLCADPFLPQYLQCCYDSKTPGVYPPRLGTVASGCVFRTSSYAACTGVSCMPASEHGWVLSDALNGFLDGACCPMSLLLIYGTTI